MTSDTLINCELQELASRCADGLDVTLYWSPGTGPVISVFDFAAGTAFQCAVAPEAAMDAFRHPYLHAPAPARDSEDAAESTRAVRLDGDGIEPSTRV